MLKKENLSKEKDYRSTNGRNLRTKRIAKKKNGDQWKVMSKSSTPLLSTQNVTAKIDVPRKGTT